MNSQLSKLIKLSKGKFALVDAKDYEWLMLGAKWCLHSQGYACRRTPDNKIETMHRVIMQTPKGLYTDHINNNRLDNRRSNLRIVTNSENLSRAVPKSGLKGVSWHGQMKQWRARIYIDGKEKHLGLFDNKVDAIKCYNEKVRELWGEYAWQNPIP